MYQYYQNCRIPLGTDVATKLPQIHAVTGCDTTSFFHGAGKIKVPKTSKWKRKNQASKGNWIVDDENEEVRSLCFTGMLSISCFHFHSNQQI